MRAHRQVPRGSKFFPSPELASPEGLLAVGGSLTPDWLVDAYTHGIFPWPVNDDLLAWWSPDPRGILEFEALYVSRRLARTCRSGRFQATCDRDFSNVLKGCATAQDRNGATWLNPQMRRAYEQLHRLGLAHSVEVWRDGRLVGGLYGVGIQGFFSAESMFHYDRDASKVAVVRLVHHLRARGYRLLDLQVLNSHTAYLGGAEIPRATYLHRLSYALELDVQFGAELESPAKVEPTGN